MLETKTIAITIMLIATSMTNIGMIFQKKGVTLLSSKYGSLQATKLKLLLRQKTWLVGWGMALIAILLNCTALGMGNISMLQPLVGFGLVVMVLFSKFYLKETIKTSNLFGILFIIAGIVLVGLNSSNSRQFNSLEELTSIYLSVKSITVFLCIMIFCLFLKKYAEKKYKTLEGISFTFAAGALSVIGLSLSKGLFASFHLPSLNFFNFEFYLLILIFILGQVISLLAFVSLQLAFNKCKAIIAMPIFHVTTILMPLIIGPIVFSEHINWEIGPAVLLIITGTLLIFICKETTK